jgi:hypothetical protein
MNRRDFLLRSTGGAGHLLFGEQVKRRELRFGSWRSYDFESFRKGKYPMPLTKVTPGDGFFIHTFYDVCPWSISRKLLLLTKLPYQGRKPTWGDKAGICIVDLERQRIREIYQTQAWSFQLGANGQWDDSSDRYVYTNDIVRGEVVCVRIDLEEEVADFFAGPKYDVSPNGKFVAGPNPINMNMHQYGYSIPDGLSGRPVPFSPEDMLKEGLWQTDLTRNEKKLLVPLQRFFDTALDKERYSGSIGYLFHTKYNRQHTKIMQVFRAQKDNKGRNASLFTLNVDGTDLVQCLSAERWNQLAKSGGSGNHPNWHPDGEHIVMNCIPTWLGHNEMMFCSFRYDGSDFRILTEKHRGSGHPSIERSGRYLVADAYPKQRFADSDEGEVPIRLIDLESDREIRLCTMPNEVGGGVRQAASEKDVQGGSHFKLDPHPVWSRDFNQLCLNGAPDGRRQVFIGDLKGIIG